MKRIGIALLFLIHLLQSPLLYASDGSDVDGEKRGTQPAIQLIDQVWKHVQDVLKQEVERNPNTVTRRITTLQNDFEQFEKGLERETVEKKLLELGKKRQKLIDDGITDGNDRSKEEVVQAIAALDRQIDEYSLDLKRLGDVPPTSPSPLRDESTKAADEALYDRLIGLFLETLRSESQALSTPELTRLLAELSDDLVMRSSTDLSRSDPSGGAFRDQQSLTFDFKTIPDALSDAEIFITVIRNQQAERIASWCGELRTERERFLRHSSQPPLDPQALANMARQRIRVFGKR